MKRGDFKEITQFVREEMVVVCHLDEESLIEIKDIGGQIVQPFSLRGRFLTLAPIFFGKNYTLYVNNEKFLELTLDFWNKYNEGDERLIN